MKWALGFMLPDLATGSEMASGRLPVRTPRQGSPPQAKSRNTIPISQYFGRRDSSCAAD